MIKNKKASMFLIVFFIAIVMIIFYMISLQSRTPSLGIQTATQTERTYNYAEMLKRFTLQVASESLTKASYEEAQALNDYNIIDDSQPNLFDLSQINSEMAERARQMVNAYLASVEGEQFGTVLFEETTSIQTANIPITEMDLIEGLVYDNFMGTFQGNELNRVINTETDEESTFEHQYLASTQCDRFYYLLHVINQWATTNIISSLVCNSMPIVQVKGSGRLYYPTINEDTARQIADMAFEDLQARFDEDVICTYTLEDLTAKTDIHFDYAMPGDEECPTNECSGGCPGDQDYETMYNDCDGLNTNIIYDGGEWHPSGTYRDVNCAGIGQTHTMIFTMKISCIDYKCANPVSAQGMEYLTMNVSAKIHQTHHTDPPVKECAALKACGGPQTAPDATTVPDEREREPSPLDGGVPGGGT